MVGYCKTYLLGRPLDEILRVALAPRAIRGRTAPVLTAATYVTLASDSTVIGCGDIVFIILLF